MNPLFAKMDLLFSRARQRLPRWSPDVLACLVIVAIGYVYLAPASHDLFDPRSDRMIGDDTDLIGLSWQYRVIVDTLLHAPSRLLYGAIYTENVNAPLGAPLWMPWIERILVPILTPITNDANLPTAVAWALMAINGASAYVFGRIVKWPRLVCLAAGICFAYNNFTRARANVHTALIGAFGIALIFIALELLSNRDFMTPERKRRSMTWASLALLAACFSAHYYLIIFIVLSPFFFLYFLLRGRSSRLPLLRSLGRLVVCSLPAVVFLGWNFMMPVPSEYKSSMGAPEIRPENASYLRGFGSHPIDYLGFDVKLGSNDWLKPRVKFSEAIQKDLAGSNLHERSNGIRWSLLAVLAAATVAYVWPKLPRASERRSNQLRGLFLLLAIACFLFSLSPQGLKSFDEELGPSLFIFKLIPVFRVPSRFGILAQFSVIVVAGEFLASSMRRWTPRRPMLNGAVGLLCVAGAVIDYAPLNPVMTAGFAPIRQELVPPSGECGMGISLPYTIYAYWLYQQTRGTNCRLMIPSSDMRSEAALQTFNGQRQWGPAKAKEFASFARCTGMDWVVFTSEIGVPAREAICKDLGWTFVAADECRSPGIAPRKKRVLECVP
ncbi:hypothetical protein [Pendulispora albinea]|uniref:Glycosyltransferase RgtA/B/C/D-like domain-containing protein n=1 Tax=Pendulispora albinea TaxID=2741071 RepID=A0ABZ2LU16_9BACT